MVAEGEVEWLGEAACYSVEGDEASVFINGDVFEGSHEGSGDAVAAMIWMNEQLGDFGAVLLIWRHVEDQLDRGGDGAGYGVAGD